MKCCDRSGGSAIAEGLNCVQYLLSGYQGSFHSIQNCFHYGDCYRTMDQSVSSDVLTGESHCFNPLRQNGYHILNAPLASTGNLFHLQGITQMIFVAGGAKNTFYIQCYDKNMFV